MNWYTRLKHWVSPAQIPAYHLGEGPGMWLGFDRHGVPVVDKRASTALIVGPCASGKTSTVVTPTLRAWPGSVVALDLHGELHAHTHEERSLQGDVAILHPGVRDSWTFRALPQEPTPEACLRVAKALVSALPDGIREGARQHAFLGLLGLPEGAELHELEVEGDSEAACALRRELEPLKSAKMRALTTREQGSPHTVYIQGKPWKSPWLGLLARLACASMSQDTLHVLDDSERYGFGGMSLERRLVTIQGAERVGRTSSLYQPANYDVVACLGVMLRQNAPLARFMGLPLERYAQARERRVALIRCRGEQAFATNPRHTTPRRTS